MNLHRKYRITQILTLVFNRSLGGIAAFMLASAVSIITTDFYITIRYHDSLAGSYLLSLLTAALLMTILTKSIMSMTISVREASLNYPASFRRNGHLKLTLLDQKYFV